MKHRPSGETWVLACDAYDGYVLPAGWPCSHALASDCELVRAATDEERVSMLRNVARSRSGPGDGYDPRRSHARHQWLGDLCLSAEERPSYVVTLPAPFENDAGTIQNIVEEEYGGAAVITSHAGAIRSNHWHRTDSHLLYVLSGSMLYFEVGLDLDRTLRRGVEAREGGEHPLPKPCLLTRGQAAYTGPRLLHTTAFLEETVLLSYSRLPRTHESHEGDVVREVLVTPERMRDLVPWVQWL